MSLEQAIHERWAQVAALAALLPAERVTTGRAMDASLPYATLACPRRRTAIRTNDGATVDDVTLRIDVWHESYDAGQAIVAAIATAFDRSDFPLAGGRRVVGMRRDGDSVTQHADGVWQQTIEFLVQVYLPSRAPT